MVKSPNKRKSVGTVGETITPKKLKTDSEAVKTPFKTPKSAKKAQQNGNDTPKQIVPKTPKSAKKGANLVATPKVADMAPTSAKKGTPEGAQALDQTPKSGKRKNKKAKAGNQENETPQVPKTPKSAKKLQKFKGTQNTEENENESDEQSPASVTDKQLSDSVVDPEKLQGLNRKQRRRLVAKMKKRSLIASKKTDGSFVESAASKTVKELTETESEKKANKKNKKQQSILNKSLGNKPEGAGKKNKKKNKPQVQKKTEDSDESDYEVETQIKPEKVTKGMNESSEDSDKEDDVTKDSDKEDDVTKDSDEMEEDGSNEEQVPPKKEQKPKGPRPQKGIGNSNLTSPGILKKGQSKYVLYIRNIPYNVTKEEITEHFAKVCPLTDVRLPLDRMTSKPRGFGYIEVANEADFQQALTLHQSMLNGRQISVANSQPSAKKWPMKRQY